MASDVPTLIAVAGPYRSGTSCVAGMLHAMGANLGEDLLGAGESNEKGFFESLTLQAALKQRFDEWAGRMLCEPASVRQALVNWLGEHRHRGARLAVKHPLFCLAPDCLESAFPGPVRWIRVRRDLEAAARSLHALPWEWIPRPASVESCRRVVERLSKAADENFAQRPALTLEYERILEAPQQAVDAIVEFVPWPVTDVEHRAAIRFVEPALAHHGARP